MCKRTIAEVVQIAGDVARENGDESLSELRMETLTRRGDGHMCQGHLHTLYIGLLLDSGRMKHFTCWAEVDVDSANRIPIDRGADVVIDKLMCCDDMALVTSFNGSQFLCSTLDLDPGWSAQEFGTMSRR